jgi:hypothetical protein
LSGNPISPHIIALFPAGAVALVSQSGRRLLPPTFHFQAGRLAGHYWGKAESGPGNFNREIREIRNFLTELTELNSENSVILSISGFFPFAYWAYFAVMNPCLHPVFSLRRPLAPLRWQGGHPWFGSCLSGNPIGGVTPEWRLEKVTTFCGI